MQQTCYTTIEKERRRGYWAVSCKRFAMRGGGCWGLKSGRGGGDWDTPGHHKPEIERLMLG